MSTGVRILPIDGIGYLVDGIPATYQGIRRMQDHWVTKYPETLEAMTKSAVALNSLHLRRLLHIYKVRHRIDDRWWLENMPRRDRASWRQSIRRAATQP